MLFIILILDKFLMYFEGSKYLIYTIIVSSLLNSIPEKIFLFKYVGFGEEVKIFLFFIKISISELYFTWTKPHEIIPSGPSKQYIIFSFSKILICIINF